MEALIEYAIIGTIALAFFYLISPTIINFFGTATDAVVNATGLSSSEQDLVSAVLLLTLLLFFLFAVWVMYASVKERIDSL